MGFMRFYIVLKRLIRPRFVALVALIPLLAACTLTAKQDGDLESQSESAPQDAVAMAKHAGMADDIYYNLIAAELAGQHEDLDNAAQAYRQALHLSVAGTVSEENKYQIARRAWEVGRFTKNTDLADQAAQVWQAQDDSFTPLLARVVAVENAAADKQTQVLAEVFDLPAPKRKAMAAVMAKHYSQNPESSAALQMIENWLELNPNDVDLLTTGAVIAEATNANAMAYQWWYRLTELSIDSKQLFNAQAHAAANLRLLGEPEEAAERLSGLHALQPDNHWLSLEYARALLQSEQPAEALLVLEKLTAALPANADVLHLAGFASYVADQYLKAAQYFEQALDKGYNDHEARYWVGLAYLQAKQPKQAIVWLGTLGQGERWDMSQHLIGDALAKLGDWEDFASHFESLRKADTEQAWRWYLAEAQSLIAVARYEQAVNVINQAVAADPEDTEVRYQRGLLFIELKRFDEAKADLAYVLELAPEHAEAMNALGYMLIDRLANTAEGLPLVKKALDLQPESAPIMDSYGWGLLLEGDLQAGLFWLEKAWSNLKDHEIGAHLGEALWLNKRPEQARQIWQEAQKIPRGNREDKILEAYERLGIKPE